MRGEQNKKRNDQIVALYMMGSSEDEIAKRFKKSKCTIHRVLTMRGIFGGPTTEEERPKRESYCVTLGQELVIKEQIPKLGTNVRKGKIIAISKHVITMLIDGQTESFSAWELGKILRGEPL